MLRQLVFLLLSLIVVDSANGVDLSSVKQFKSQRLWRAAERQCNEILGESNLSPSDAALTTIELLQVLAGHALDVPTPPSEAIWKELDRVGQNFDTRFPNNPFRILVEFQWAVGLVARAELERMSAKANRLEFDESLRVSRSALKILKRIHTEIPHAIGRSSQNRNAPNLKPVELQRLQQKMEYQIGRVYQNIALCYPAESDDYVNGLTQALQRFQSLARLRSHRDLAVQSRLLEAKTHRMLRNWMDADRRLKDLESDAKLDRKTSLAMATERAYWSLDQDDVASAIAKLENTSYQECRDQRTIAEFHIARVESYTKAISLANGVRLQNLERRRQQTLTEIERSFSLYWKFHADGIVSQSQKTIPAANNALMRQADSFMRQGQHQEALQKYEEAVELAKRDENHSVYVLAHFRAGAIEHHLKRHREALNRLRKCSLAYPGEPAAVEAHLLAIYAAAQIARSGDKQDVETYITTLQEQIKHWPSDGPTRQARVWLGQIYARLGRWREAVDSFSGVDVSWSGFSAVLDQMTDAYFEQIQHASEDSRQDILMRAFQDLQTIYDSAMKQKPDDFRSICFNAKLGQTEMRLMFHAHSLNADELFLSKALRQDLSSTQRSHATRLLYLCYALQKKHILAAQQIDESLMSRPAPWFRTVDRLYQELESTKDASSLGLAKLLLATMKRMDLASDQITSRDRLRWQIIQAKCLAATNQMDRALVILNRLVKSDPRNLDFRLTLATTVASSPRSEHQNQALREWRTIVNGSKPGTEIWFRGKYSIALSLYKLNQFKRAAELIRITKSLHPDLGGDELKRQFHSLLRKCEAK